MRLGAGHDGEMKISFFIIAGVREEQAVKIARDGFGLQRVDGRVVEGVYDHHDQREINEGKHGATRGPE